MLLRYLLEDKAAHDQESVVVAFKPQTGETLLFFSFLTRNPYLETKVWSVVSV